MIQSSDERNKFTNFIQDPRCFENSHQEILSLSRVSIQDEDANFRVKPFASKNV